MSGWVLGSLCLHASCVFFSAFESIPFFAAMAVCVYEEEREREREKERESVCGGVGMLVIVCIVVARAVGGLQCEIGRAHV